MPAKPTTLRESAPGLRKLGRHVRPHLRRERLLIVLGLLALFAEVAMRLLEPWPLKYVIDGVIAGLGADINAPQPADLPVVIAVACGALLVIVALRALFAYLTTVCFALVGNRLLTSVRGDLFAHLQKLPMAFHDRARTGDLVQRVTSDVGRLKEVSVTAALPLFGNVVTLLAMVVVIAIMDLPLALTTLVVLPLFGLLSVRLGKRIRTVSRKQRSAEGALASHVNESLAAMRVVKTYSLEQRMQQLFSGSNQRSLADGVKATRLSAGLERKTDVLVGVGTAVVLFVGAQRVLDGAMTPGELVVFLTYLKAAFKPMRDVAKYVGRIAQAAASSERIVAVLETEPAIADKPDAVAIDRARGDITFSRVWLTYGRHLALRGVDLHIPAGQRIALLGASGSGKSSLAMMISRLCDPRSGAVLIDGVDVRDLTIESLRAQSSVVLQESVLFATTIAENIAFGLGEVDHDRIVAAATLAGAHDFITAMPDGYDTVVGERGSTLSGGQRQRIAIARAAMRDAPIIILDEATTGIDASTEAEVLAALGRLTAGRTTIMISHDLDTALGCDRAVWIEHGRLVDDGHPADVLARRGHPVRPVADRSDGPRSEDDTTIRPVPVSADDDTLIRPAVVEPGAAPVASGGRR